MFENWWLALVLGIIAIMISCAMFCVHSLARKVPTNYILMGAFTFCEAYLVAFSCAAVNDRDTVIMAIFMTASIVVALSAYAVVAKTDFTAWGGLLFILGATFIMFGVFSFIFGPTMKLVYCILGVLLFGVYLIFDTQFIVGGKRKY